MTPDEPQTRMTDCRFCHAMPEGPFENLKDGEDEDDLPIKCWTIFHKCPGVWITVEGATKDECAAIWNRTRSVEPPREMVERAKSWLVAWTHSWPAKNEERAAALVAEFTSVRSQAIEMCAGVADDCAGDKYPSPDAMDAARSIAASIRSLR